MSAARTQGGEDDTEIGGCIGISLEALLDSIRPSTSKSPVTTVLRKARTMLQTTQCNPKKMNSRTGSELSRSMFRSDDTFEREQSFLEREKSFMRRMTPSFRSQTTETDDTASNQVKFHDPPITSVKLRPRTEEHERTSLFFQDDELDQISLEDDLLDQESQCANNADGWNKDEALRCPTDSTEASSCDGHDATSVKAETKPNDT